MKPTYEWVVSDPEDGDITASRTESVALDIARAEYEAGRDIKVFRRELGPWVPVMQSMFPPRIRPESGNADGS